MGLLASFSTITGSYFYRSATNLEDKIESIGLGRLVLINLMKT